MPAEPPVTREEERAILKRAQQPAAPARPPVDLSRGALPQVFEKEVTPLRLFISSIIAVFVSQFFVGLALRHASFSALHSREAEALLSAIALVILIVPVMYAAVYRPMIRHIARQQRLENALRELATVDELTEVLNRRGFRALADAHLRLAKRFKKGICCLFMDLNDFKRINDALGHNVGDLALIETARILKSSFRESDLVARVGGDEFVVFALETGAATAERMVARLQEKLSAANAQPDRKYRLSLCIGVARCDAGEECAVADLVARADSRMYEQKQALRAAPHAVAP